MNGNVTRYMPYNIHAGLWGDKEALLYDVLSSKIYQGRIVACEKS